MFWNQGCAKALQMKIIQNLHVIGIVAIVIAFFQVITFSIDVDCRDEIFSVALQQSSSKSNFISYMFSLQLFGLIISMLLFCTIKHKRKSDTYKSYSPTNDSSGHQRQSSYLDDQEYVRQDYNSVCFQRFPLNKLFQSYEIIF